MKLDTHESNPFMEETEFTTKENAFSIDYYSTPSRDSLQRVNTDDW